MAENVMLSAAQTVVEAARAKAEEIGVPMKIAVFDGGNNLDGVRPHPGFDMLVAGEDKAAHGNPLLGDRQPDHHLWQVEALVLGLAARRLLAAASQRTTPSGRPDRSVC
ncbi:MAG: hypothetical protein JO321_09155 [Solirubrobacterales bacterium]|nr:hypothetical protein [Solirubrobacterales bacterium]MBV9535564.1 hypothetical protein [Solirubrobacterales bacterium]